MRLLNDAQKAKVNDVLRGPDGLRAGWSVLLFIALIAAIMLTVHALVQMMHLPKSSAAEMTLQTSYVNELIMVAVTVIATAIMARIEKKPFGAYGLRGPRSGRNFVIGLVVGLASLSSLVGLLYVNGYLAFDGLALHGASMLGYGIVWFGGFMLVAVNEEMMVRGYLQDTLFRGMGPWPAMLVLSLLFMVMHMGNPGENTIGLIGVFAAGVFLCLLRWISGSLWLGIGFHAAWDWSQSYLYGTPDSGYMVQGHLMITHAIGDLRMSGGTAGPEGSLFANPVLLVGMMTLLWIIRRQKSQASA